LQCVTTVSAEVTIFLDRGMARRADRFLAALFVQIICSIRNEQELSQVDSRIEKEIEMEQKDKNTLQKNHNRITDEQCYEPFPLVMLPRLEQ